MALNLHQERKRPRVIPQSLRGDFRLQRGRIAGARLPHLFCQQGRLQAVWLLPAGHDRRMAIARRCCRQDRRSLAVIARADNRDRKRRRARRRRATRRRDDPHRDGFRHQQCRAQRHARTRRRRRVPGRLCEACRRPALCSQHRLQFCEPRTAAQSARHRHLRQDAPPLQHGDDDRRLSRTGAARLASLCRLRRAETRAQPISTARRRRRLASKICASNFPVSTRRQKCCRSA